MDFAEKGQLIEFNDDDRVFFSLSGKASIDEEELRNIFAQTIKGIQYRTHNALSHVILLMNSPRERNRPQRS